MLRQLASLLILVFTLTCLSGCSRELSRARTKSLIAESSAFRENRTIELVPGGAVIDHNLRSLEKGGLVRITPGKCGYFNNADDVCGDVALTEKGVEASRGWTEDFYWCCAPSRKVKRYYVPVASRAGIEITGLKEEPMVGMVAEFKWKCQLNDLGQTIQPDVSKVCPPVNNFKQSAALFKRYDDGWRLENISW